MSLTNTMSNVMVSIIYVYYNTPTEIINSLQSISSGAKEIPYEVIIIDNLSPIPLPNTVKKFLNIKTIVNRENLGYGKGLNQGAKFAKGKYVLFVNPDTIFIKDSIKRMVKKMESDQTIGILGPQFLDENKNISKVGSGLPFLPDAIFVFSFLSKLFPNNPFIKQYYLTDLDRNNTHEFPVICGACMLMKKSFFEKIHGFDEQFFMYFEESDMCYRVKKAGKEVLYYSDAKVIHLGGRSSNDTVWIRKVFEESRYKFFKKYHNAIVAFLGEYSIRLLNNISKIIP